MAKICEHARFRECLPRQPNVIIDIIWKKSQPLSHFLWINDTFFQSVSSRTIVILASDSAAEIQSPGRHTRPMYPRGEPRSYHGWFVCRAMKSLGLVANIWEWKQVDDSNRNIVFFAMVWAMCITRHGKPYSKPIQRTFENADKGQHSEISILVIFIDFTISTDHFFSTVQGVANCQISSNPMLKTIGFV